MFDGFLGALLLQSGYNAALVAVGAALLTVHAIAFGPDGDGTAFVERRDATAAELPVLRAASSAIIYLVWPPLAIRWPWPRWVLVMRSSVASTLIAPTATASSPA